MKNIDPSIYLFDWRDVRIRYADDPPFKYRVTFKIVDRIFIEGLREKKKFRLHSTGDTNHAARMYSPNELRIYIRLHPLNNPNESVV